MMQILLTYRLRSFMTLATAGVFVVTTLAATQQQPPAPAPQPQQPSEVSTTITGDQPGMAPRLAVPDFVALSTDAETVDAAKTIGRVLWDDLNYEREFAMLPRDVMETVPVATSDTVPFDRWRELAVDALVVGTVRKTGAGVEIEVRLFNVRSGQSVFATKYSGAVASKRSYAHRISDDIHWQQRNLQGVAQTKLTFSSDRTGERFSGTVDNRGVREIMIVDYDGENAVRVTTDRSLNIAPVWSPDARSIVYTSYRRVVPNLFVANIYEGTGGILTDVTSQNWLPAWSPDGKRIAFSSMRDGNSEIYVINRDGSDLRRLTNNRSDDTTPAWSPTGARIAFTSDRTGSPQIWEMDSDGLGQRPLTHESRADRATWSLAPFNQIAFAAQTGPGNDIKILDMTTGTVRQLTFGEGTNESPVFAPNGRHIAFVSTRAGKEQIFTMDTDGKNVRQITRTSSNKYPNWSQGPRK
jgi:TolB protein